jgi:hypothetical protein
MKMLPAGRELMELSKTTMKSLLMQQQQPARRQTSIHPGEGLGEGNFSRGCTISVRFANPLRTALCSALVLLLLVLSHNTSLADDLAEKGRAIFKKNQHVVLTVQLVIKSKFSVGGLGNQSNESRQDVTGTVLDPSGLTVLSLSVTDPGQMMQEIVSGMADEDAKFKMETELSDIKMLLEDGTEVPAEVVLRDKDLDLAFIRPKAKLVTPLQALDFNNSGKAELLDQVIALNRLGGAAGRAYAASIERVSAVVERPRLFYVPEATMTQTTLGSPAFTLDGKVLGLFVTRSLKQKGNGTGFFGISQPEPATAIVIPADAVLKAAKQAPAVPETKEKDKAVDSKSTEK